METTERERRWFRPGAGGGWAGWDVLWRRILFVWLGWVAVPAGGGAEAGAGAGDSPWIRPPLVPHPRLEHRRYPSEILRAEVGYQVWFPPGYGQPADRANRHPVVYWLHDREGDEGRPALRPEILEAGVAGGILPPFLVVYVNGGGNSWFRNTADGLRPAELTMLEELIPQVDRSLRTVASRDGRVVMGLGMGGHGAVRLAAAHPERFCAAVALRGEFRPVTDFATNRALAEVFLRVFGGDTNRFQREGPLAVARTNALVLRDRTGFLFLQGKGDPWRREAETLARALTGLGLSARTEQRPVTGEGSGGVLLDDAAFAALEFASGWLGNSRRLDRDGPWLTPPATNLPRLRHHVFQSRILGRSVGYTLYLPERDAVRSPESGPLPVLYHLHGRLSHESAHLETAAYLDSAIGFAGLSPMAWVWLYGGRLGWFTDSADGVVPSERVLLDEAIPHIESRWRLGGAPERRGVDGWGMGAWGALRLATTRPSRFRAVLLHEPLLPDLATMQRQFPEAWNGVFGQDAARFRKLEPLGMLSEGEDEWRSRLRIRLVVGDRSGQLLDALRLREWLTRHSFEFEYELVPGRGDSESGHYEVTGLRDLRYVAERIAGGAEPPKIKVRDP
jgi:enterochelin esterase-like enzyme